MNFDLFSGLNLTAPPPPPKATRSGHVLFVGLNPSTADATLDDQTIRKERAFVRSWGYGLGMEPTVLASGARLSPCGKHRFSLWRPGLVKVNLFSYRETEPRNLLLHLADASVDENDLEIMDQAKRAALVVCAWGGPYQPKDLARAVAERAAQVVDLLLHVKGELHVLALTKDGIPRHPLYLRGDLTPKRWK